MIQFDIGTDTKVPITDAQGLEYHGYAARVADGIVVTSAVADLSESITTWKLNGSGAVDRLTPVKDVDYALTSIDSRKSRRDTQQTVIRQTPPT